MEKYFSGQMEAFNRRLLESQVLIFCRNWIRCFKRSTSATRDDNGGFQSIKLQAPTTTTKKSLTFEKWQPAMPPFFSIPKTTMESGKWCRTWITPLVKIIKKNTKGGQSTFFRAYLKYLYWPNLDKRAEQSNPSLGPIWFELTGRSTF